MHGNAARLGIKLCVRCGVGQSPFSGLSVLRGLCCRSAPLGEGGEGQKKIEEGSERRAGVSSRHVLGAGVIFPGPGCSACSRRGLVPEVRRFSLCLPRKRGPRVAALRRAPRAPVLF